MAPTDSIHFFKEDISFRLQRVEDLKKWISSVFRKYGCTALNVNFIFCSDRYLLRMNKDYLQHHYLTDIITFDNSAEKGNVEADIFISADRISDNAKKFETTFQDELHRVMVHGVLHLCGYGDKNPAAKKEMSRQEDIWLAKRKFIRNS